MNVAFIPVRGGSKSIPLKNIKEICGKPLVYWTVKAACQCKDIDMVYVSTDSEEIKAAVEKFKVQEQDDFFDKVKVIGRDAKTATDTASTESAMLEFAEKYEFENIVLIQATSPMLSAKDLAGGFVTYKSKGTDSVISVVRQYRFMWSTDGEYVLPANYDVFHRPRRQEFEGYLVENGAFYITSKQNLLKSKNRISGNIKAYEMCEDSVYEIDEPSDWIIIENLMQKNGIIEKNELDIKMFLTDCDGCLTDGGMYYSENGDELKKFNTKDGMGFALLRSRGIITGIITGEDTQINRRRAKKLKLDILENGCQDKLSAVKAVCQKKGIALKNVAYVGDDVNDLELLKAVGFSCCPADAIDQVKEHVDYVTNVKGGEGVIREVCEIIMGKAGSINAK